MNRDRSRRRFPTFPMLNSAGETTIASLLAIIGFGLLAAAGWTAGLFTDLPQTRLSIGVAVMAALVGAGFLVIASAMYRDVAVPGIAKSATLIPGAAPTPTSSPTRFNPSRTAITALVSALAATLAFLTISGWAISQFDQSIRLPLLIVVTLVALLAAIAFVVVAFGIFRLVDRNQALGMPPGSVQAIIAMSLLLLFITMTVFLVMQMNQGNPTDPAIDIAKQVLTVLGTLVTAVSSFYFGSRSSTDAVRGSQIPNTNPGAEPGRGDPAPEGSPSPVGGAAEVPAAGALSAEPVAAATAVAPSAETAPDAAAPDMEPGITVAEIADPSEPEVITVSRMFEGDSDSETAGAAG